MNPPGETREERERMTRLALSRVVRRRMTGRRPRRISQAGLARRSGVSRSYVYSVLAAEASGPLFLYLELCGGLATDPCDLLRELLYERDAIRGASRDA